MQRGHVQDADKVALLPSGLTHSNRLTNPLTNMNHFLRDHLLLEAEILRKGGVSLVLGAAHRQKLNAVGLLRERLFNDAGVPFSRESYRPDGSGCYKRLYTYPWSCDRDLYRYSASGADLGVLHWLRKLMPSHDVVRTPGKQTLLLYGRSDAHRRRLLNISAHLATFRSQFEPGRRVVLWDDVWSTQPPVHRQAEIIREASELVTPHGAWPSVWGLFLRARATVVEVFSSCMTHSWLPAHVMRVLNVRHIALGGRQLGNARVLIDENGKVVRGCPQWPKDPDILIRPPELLAARVAHELKTPRS